MTGSLHNEPKTKRAFARPEQEAILNLPRFTGRLQLQFERLFCEHGLTHSQYNVLRILRGEGKPLPILEIAARTIAVLRGITRLIDRPERAALVERQAHGAQASEPVLIDLN